MILTTLALAASLATSTPSIQHAPKLATGSLCSTSMSRPLAPMPPSVGTPKLAISLHSMTDEEKRLFPGRERFDKTEWYESCYKSARTLIAPEHVDEWKNGGIDEA